MYSGYTSKLRIHPKSKRHVHKLNESIRLFNLDVSLWEERFHDLKSLLLTYVHDKPELQAEIESRGLFSDLPFLRIRECEEYRKEEPILKDHRTGIEYSWSLDGVLHYLYDKFQSTHKVNPVVLPDGDSPWENTELKLLSLSIEYKSSANLSLCKAFEIGCWLTYARKRYDEEVRNNKEKSVYDRGIPFGDWAVKHMKYSKSYISRLQGLYHTLQNHDRILQCSVSLSFILQNLKYIALILGEDENASKFFASGSTLPIPQRKEENHTTDEDSD